MACFLAPTAEAIILTIVKKRMEKKEKNLSLPSAEKAGTSEQKIPFSRKLGWLTNMLWGGSFLLMFEHIWHGEVVPWPPFLTAMSSAEATAEMLQEIATVGVSMAILVTAVWGVMLLVSKQHESQEKELNSSESLEG